MRLTGICAKRRQARFEAVRGEQGKDVLGLLNRENVFRTSIQAIPKGKTRWARAVFHLGDQRHRDPLTVSQPRGNPRQ